MDIMMWQPTQWSSESHEWHGTLWTWWCHITNSEALRVTSDMVPCGHDDVTSQTVKLWESRVTWYPVDMMMSHRTQWSSESHEWHVTLWTWWYDNPHSEALRVTSDMVPYGHDDVTSHAVELSESQMTCYPMTWWCHITNSEALRVNSDIVTYGHDDVTTHTVKLWESRVTWYPVDMMMSLHKQWSCQSHEWHGTLWTWWCHITNSEAVRVTSDMVPCGHDDVTSHTVELSESQMTCHSMDMIRWHHTQGSSQSHEWYFTLWTSSCNMTQLFWQPQGSRQTLPISYSSHQFSASLRQTWTISALIFVGQAWPWWWWLLLVLKNLIGEAITDTVNPIQTFPNLMGNVDR